VAQPKGKRVGPLLRHLAGYLAWRLASKLAR
jgi:hypothetical protein